MMRHVVMSSDDPFEITDQIGWGEGMLANEEVYVTVMIFGGETGGIETNFKLDFQYGANAGLYFDYISVADGSFVDVLRGMGATVTVLGKSLPNKPPAELARSPRAAWAAFQQCKETGAEIGRVLSNHPRRLVYACSPYNILALSLGMKQSKRRVVAGFSHMLSSSRFMGMQRRIYSNLVYNRCRAAICPSLAVKNSLTGKLRESAIVLPHAIDFEEVERPIVDVSKKSTQIVALGRISPVKNLHVAIHAVQKLREEGEDCSLMVIGGPTDDGNPTYRSLKGIIDTKHSDAVLLVGPHNPPYKLLAEAPIFVNCSVHEAFGYVVPEAIACGCACIVADRGGPSELVIDGETGLHYRSEDIDDLAAKIRRLLHDRDEISRLTSNARRYAVEHFDQKARIVRLKSIFQRLRAEDYRSSV